MWTVVLLQATALKAAAREKVRSERKEARCACQPPTSRELRTTACRERCEITGGCLTAGISLEPAAASVTLAGTV
jgi:hypothetical protein